MLRNLSRDRKILYASALAIILLLTPLFFVNKNVSRYVIAVLLVLSAILVSIFLKRRSVLSIHKRTVALILFVVSTLGIVIYYVSGIYYGFFRNPYVTTFSSSVIRILAVGASIIAIEVIRRVFLSYEGKIITCLMYLAGIFVDIIISPDLIIFTDFSAFMRLFGLTVLPSLAANALYNYTSKRYGMYACLAYRLPVELYRYVFTNISGIVDVLHSFIKITIPILALVFVDLLYERKVRRARRKNHVVAHAVTAFLALLMVSVVMLISGRFKYTLLVIGSESMTGTFDKGDGVIYEKYEGYAREGDVIVFNKDGTKLVHRIVRIERINGQNRYYTKGDANKNEDAGFITDSQIEGVVKIKISYVGHPTLWVRSLFK